MCVVLRTNSSSRDTPSWLPLFPTENGLCVFQRQIWPPPGLTQFGSRWTRSSTNRKTTRTTKGFSIISVGPLRESCRPTWCGLFERDLFLSPGRSVRGIHDGSEIIYQTLLPLSKGEEYKCWNYYTEPTRSVVLSLNKEVRNWEPIGELVKPVVSRRLQYHRRTSWSRLDPEVSRTNRRTKDPCEGSVVHYFGSYRPTSHSLIYLVSVQ